MQANIRNVHIKFYTKIPKISKCAFAPKDFNEIAQVRRLRQMLRPAGLLGCLFQLFLLKTLLRVHRQYTTVTLKWVVLESFVSEAGGRLTNCSEVQEGGFVLGITALKIPPRSSNNTRRWCSCNRSQCNTSKHQCWNETDANKKKRAGWCQVISFWKPTPKLGTTVDPR